MGGAQTSDSASNLLCATRETNRPQSRSLSLLDAIYASVYEDLIRALMGGQAQLSDSAVVTVLQGSHPLFSLQRQAGGQCGDVWWGGPPLLQGKAQLGTIDRSK